MRLPVPWVVFLLVLATAPVRGESESTTTTTLPQPPAEQVTAVRGAVPDLIGRWLAVAWLDIPGDRLRTAVFLLSVEPGERKPTVMSRYVGLPSSLEAKMEQANEANRRWEPTPEEIARIAAAWDDLPANATHPARVEHTITARDAFDETFTSEPRMRDAQWVLMANETFDASAAPAVRQVKVYGAREVRAGGGWTGNFTSTMIVAAPFPIPITLQGTFELVPLPPPRGLLARLADLFAGCGRPR